MAILYAFLITLIAGLATGIGALLTFGRQKPNTLFLSFSLGFSAGIMLYVSFMEILPMAINVSSQANMIFGFFMGVMIIALIDVVIPNNENPHEFFHKTSDLKQLQTPIVRCHLLKIGVLTALAIAIHNFPEGFVTFVSLVEYPQIGLGIAIAIALHNIPEGIAISVPIFYATNNRIKAFVYSFLSGLSEPIGAIFGYWLLKPFLSQTVLGMILSATAGIMVYIALEELLPTAKRYSQNRLSILSVFVGMLVMALSLWIIP